MKPAPGVVIGGKYVLERRLATGGQGSIWRARHTQLDAEVAIKLMDPLMADSPMARTRFEREAQAAARIRHRNVVHVQDCGIDNGMPYLVMELFQGEDLSKRIRTRKRIPIDETSRILFQISKGLRTLHDAGYIHRDIKPGNIFITLDDEGQELVKLLDFGIIKGPGGSIGEHTKTGEFMGSPHYMSPEQIQGAKDIDSRSDLWALGVVLFRMLTGQLPFPGEGIGAVVAEILARPVPSARLLASDLPEGIDEFFYRALARPREKRFQSVGEMAEAFGRIAGVRVPMPSISLIIDDAPSTGMRPAAGAPAIDNPLSLEGTTLPRAQRPEAAPASAYAVYAAPPSGPTPLAQLQSTMPISPEEMRAAMQQRQAELSAQNAQKAPYAQWSPYKASNAPSHAQANSQGYPQSPASQPQPDPAPSGAPPRRSTSYGALPVPSSPSAPSERSPSSGAHPMPAGADRFPAELNRLPMGPMGTFMLKPGGGSPPSGAPSSSGPVKSSGTSPSAGASSIGSHLPGASSSFGEPAGALHGDETVVGGDVVQGGRANSMTWWLVGGLLVGAMFGIVIAIMIFVVRP